MIFLFPNSENLSKTLLSYIIEKHAGIKSDLVSRKKIDEEFGEQLKQIITEFKKTKKF